jgi:DNA-binding FadR family transcriptional regulator
MRAMKRKQMLYEAVQEEIKTYILRNDLKAGDPLPPETELAHQLDISRNSVREAVKALEALGILEARAGTGLFVREFNFDAILNNLAYGMLFDLKSLTDAMTVRFQLEYGMAETVVERVTPDQVQRLHSILDDLKTAAMQGYYSAEADRAFHRCLYDNVNNQLLWNVLDIFWKVLRLAQDHARVPAPVDPVETYRVHVPIVEAVVARDAKRLQDAMRQHYAGIEARIRRFEEKRQENDSASS